jgi:hypothetical protein
MWYKELWNNGLHRYVGMVGCEVWTNENGKLNVPHTPKWFGMCNNV